MKVGIVTINFGRLSVLRLFARSIERLRKDCGWFPVVCVSEREDEAICKKHGIHHIYQKNDPASEKWNTGVKWLMTQEVDYIMIVGSDDIVSTDLFQKILAEADKGVDMIGVTKLYFYCASGKHKGILLHFVSPKILGVCKTIKIDIIRALGGNICTNGKSWAMDASMHKNISPRVKTSAIVDGVVCDVKSSKSLNRFTFWLGKLRNHINPKLFYDTLSEEEMHQLKRVQ